MNILWNNIAKEVQKASENRIQSLKYHYVDEKINISVTNDDQYIVIVEQIGEQKVTKKIQFVTEYELNSPNFLTKKLVKDVTFNNVHLLHLKKVDLEELELNTKHYMGNNEDFYTHQGIKYYLLDAGYVVGRYFKNQALASNLQKAYSFYATDQVDCLSHNNELIQFWLPQHLFAGTTCVFNNSKEDINTYYNWCQDLEEFLNKDEKLIIENSNNLNWHITKITKNLDFFENFEGIYSTMDSMFINRVIIKNRDIFGAVQILRNYEQFTNSKSEYYYTKAYTKNLNALMGDYFYPISFKKHFDDNDNVVSKLSQNQYLSNINKLDLCSKLFKLSQKLYIPEKIAYDQISLFDKYYSNNVESCMQTYVRFRELFRLIANDFKNQNNQELLVYKYHLEAFENTNNEFINTYIQKLQNLANLISHANDLELKTKQNQEFANMHIAKQPQLNYQQFNESLNKILDINNLNIVLEKFKKSLNTVNINSEKNLLKDQTILENLKRLNEQNILDINFLKNLGVYNLFVKNQNIFEMLVLKNHILYLNSFAQKQKDILCVLISLIEKSHYYYDK